MRWLGWDHCPDDTRRQVRQLLDGFRQLLGDTLVGAYLHGPLALGCFNPAASDLDLLAVVRQRLPIPTKRSLVELLLVVSNSPHPVEISLLGRDDLVPWRYPTPFELHYCEDRRQSFRQALTAGQWNEWDQPSQTDSDLAANITVMRQRGIVLWGEPIQAVFPDVPRADYLAAILSDLRWAQQRLGSAPGLVYAVLNSCRVCAYVRDGRILSKAEGAEWGLSHLPREYAPLIRRARNAYRRGLALAGFATGDDRIAEHLLQHVLAQAAG